MFTFQISYLVHEVKNIVYLEFYVTVANVRQNATAVAIFYHASNVTVTVNTLSALLGMTVSKKVFIFFFTVVNSLANIA